MKSTFLTAEFYRNTIFRFGKKRTKWSLLGDDREEIAWNLKYQIQDPIILHVYELNIVNAKTSLNFELTWQHSMGTSDQN